MFGIVGIAMVLTLPSYYDAPSGANQALQRALLILAFVILPSFALSVAGKYLSNKR